MKDIVPELRDKALLLGWIAGLFLAGLLLWSLTQSLQAAYLLRAVNRVFITREDNRRLAAPRGRRPITVNPLGVWYSMVDADEDMFVTVIMWEGMLVPCGALVSPEGRVTDMVPLSGSAGQLLGQIPPAVRGLHVRRIESASAERGGQ